MQFPSSSECPVNTNQIQGNITLRDGQSILLLNLRSLQIEDPVKISNSSAILHGADLCCFRGGKDTSFERLCLFLRSEETSKGNLDFPPGRKDLALVFHDKFIDPGFLEVNVVLDPPVIQDIPPKPRSD